MATLLRGLSRNASPKVPILEPEQPDKTQEPPKDESSLRACSRTGCPTRTDSSHQNRPPDRSRLSHQNRTARPSGPEAPSTSIGIECCVVFSIRPHSQFIAILVIVGGMSLVFPSKKVTTLAFLVFGLPVWWWLYRKLSADPLDRIGLDAQWCANYILPFSAAFVLCFALGMFRVWLKSRPRQISGVGYKAIDAGVPHALVTLGQAQDASSSFTTNRRFTFGPSLWVSSRLSGLFGSFCLTSKRKHEAPNWAGASWRDHAGRKQSDPLITALPAIAVIRCFVFYLILLGLQHRSSFRQRLFGSTPRV